MYHPLVTMTSSLLLMSLAQPLILPLLFHHPRQLNWASHRHALLLDEAVHVLYHLGSDGPPADLKSGALQDALS